MQKVCTLFLAFFIVFNSIGQDLPDYDNIKLELKEDYTPYTDSVAVVASNYVLSQPIDTETLPKIKSLQYIIKWMTGTPNYSFTLGEPIGKISKSNRTLLTIYMAALTKYAVENRMNAPAAKEVNLNALKLLLEYCKVPSNNVKVKGELKKVMEAYEKGELEKKVG
jgi:hypothetical protein